MVICHQRAFAMGEMNNTYKSGDYYCSPEQRNPFPKRDPFCL
jgi:hypothetical protein